MQTSTAEANQNGSTARQTQHPALYPVRLVYDAVIIDPGSQMQNQTLLMSPQPLMQWMPYAHHAQSQINQMQTQIPQFIPMQIQRPRASIPPWLQKRNTNQNPNDYTQQFIRTQYGALQTPGYVMHNHLAPITYPQTTIAQPLNNRGVVINQIRQTLPTNNVHRIQTPQNVLIQTSNVCYDQRYSQIQDVHTAQTMTNTADSGNDNTQRGDKTQRGRTRIPPLSNIDQSQTDRPQKLPNSNVSHSRANQSSNFVAVNPTVRHNVKLENSNNNKVAIPVNPFIKSNKVAPIVNNDGIAKENKANQINEDIKSSLQTVCSNGKNDYKIQLQINRKPKEVALSCNNEINPMKDKRKNSSESEGQKKIKGLEEIEEKVNLNVNEIRNELKDEIGINNCINVKEEVSSKLNDLTILKHTNDKRTFREGDLLVSNKVQPKNKVLNHVIEGIVIQESKYPFKQKSEEKLDKSNSNGNEENKTVSDINTDKDDYKQPRYNILNHVIDGIVIQESDVPFAIRTPLTQKSPTNRIVKSDNINGGKTDEEIKEKYENKDRSKKERLQSEKGSTKERDESDLNEGNEMLRKLLENKDLNNLEIANVGIIKMENETVVLEDDDGSKYVKHADEEGADIRKLDTVDVETLKSWTCDDLQNHLRSAWCSCFEALKREEVDGRALILVEERQLIDVGLHSEHARDLCNLVRRSGEADMMVY